jgi:pimeloyl-ACP methyl ester carboxylesterase
VQLDERVNDDGAGESPPRPEPAVAVTLHTRAGDVRVRVWPAVDGGPGRPLLLCLHGITNTGEVFGPLATALGRRWTVVAPDAPGHGGTPWTPAARYRIADHAATALAVLDRLPEVAGHRAPVVLHGHSMGALTAARLAAARPVVVRHLLLEDPARATGRRVPSAATLRAQLAAQQALDDDALRALGREAMPRWAPDEIEPWARSKRDVPVETFAVPIDWGEPLMALLADVRRPVTIVHGTLAQGGIVSAVAARRCAAACRGGCEVVALDCGHNPRREAREPFLAVLASVLGRYER